MRIAPLVLLLLCPCVSHADSRKVTAIPRALGRTARNMVTFRDKQAAIEEWGNVGVGVADVVTTHNLLQQSASASEANPLFGKRPSLGFLLSFTLATAWTEAGLTQYSHEHYDQQSHWVTFTPIVFYATAHVTAIAISESNFYQACRQAHIVCQ